jgi:hypothetical protein
MCPANPIGTWLGSSSSRFTRVRVNRKGCYWIPESSGRFATRASTRMSVRGSEGRFTNTPFSFRSWLTMSSVANSLTSPLRLQHGGAPRSSGLSARPSYAFGVESPTELELVVRSPNRAGSARRRSRWQLAALCPTRDYLEKDGVGSTGSGARPQMDVAYSRAVRSAEKGPIAATFMIALASQASG